MEPGFTIPPCSLRLLWRLGRLFRDIVFLAHLPDNDRGACWAGNAYFTRKYACDEATVRRHLAVLAAHGWVEVEVSGPNRRVTPLVTPAEVAFFAPPLARLLCGKVRPCRAAAINRVPVPVSAEREKNSNLPEKGQRSVKASAILPPLSPDEAEVVAKAAKAGVSPDCAEDLVRRLGHLIVADAVDAVVFREEKATKTPKAGQKATADDTILDRGAYVRVFAEKLASGTWKLPPGLLAARDRAERSAERARVTEQRGIACAAGGNASLHRVGSNRKAGESGPAIILPPAILAPPLTDEEKAAARVALLEGASPPVRRLLEADGAVAQQRASAMIAAEAQRRRRQ